MTPLRVLHATPPEASGSGIGRYAHRLARELAATGQVEVTATGTTNREINSVGDVFAHARAVAHEAARGNFDLLHAECGLGALREYWSAAAVIAAQTLPVLVTVHDPGRPVWMPWLTHSLRERGRLTGASWRLGGDLALMHERWMMGRTARVHTLTRAGRADVLATFDNLADDHVVRIGHLSGVPAGSVPTRSDGPLRVGYFGHWYGGKGLGSLTTAIAGLDRAGVPVHLTLSGSISVNAGRRMSQAYRAAVLRDIAAMNTQHIVTLAGHVPDDEVPDFLAGFDVVVLPYEPGLSRSGASSVLYDVQAAGVPVIATDARAMQEDINHGVDGLVYPANDTLVLVAHLVRLASDRDMLARLQQGAELTAQRVRRESVTDQFIELYAAVSGVDAL